MEKLIRDFGDVLPMLVLGGFILVLFEWLLQCAGRWEIF